MTPERWKTIEDIFQEALDCAPAARAAFLDEKCAGDAELRTEIEKLIDRFEQEETFLESPVWTDSVMLGQTLKNRVVHSLEEESGVTPENQPLIGRRIGVYRLTEELGKGGMGAVYLAERADGEFHQKAAVKLIRRGMDTDFIVRRFRHERQILANLNHPNIARLLDGGTTDDDSPYFVMEYVEGEPFLKYCETKKLDLRDRLKLFIKVCEAIGYAHKRRIIHRDIKPSNIIVSEDGTPKLLDFGIAKILDPDLIHESVMPTATQMRLMTPEYASPEQVRGDEITPASDQYSLGVLLYELLTGSRPYKFPSRAPHEIARIICEEIPVEPSSGDFGRHIAEALHSASDPESRRQLDRIVLKTLRKEAGERYGSVKDLSQDLERFLRNERVRAESFAKEIQTPLVPEPPAVSRNSIAVLPFKVLTAGASGETDEITFLGMGLADSLITRLSNIRQFVVRPTSSVLRYSTKGSDSLAAGGELGVRYVLDGNILRAGRRIRISVQLLDVASQSTVWAERFDDDFTDVLQLEDKISTRVAESLVPQLSTGEIQHLAKRGTDQPKAYEAYLRGRYHWNTFTEDGFAKAFVAYHEAISYDPGYALAHVGIADYYIWLGVYGILPPKDCYPSARESALQAIRIDPQSAEAFASLGFAQLCGDFDRAESERNARRSLEINPDYAVAHLWYSYNLMSYARFDEAVIEARTAVGLDPLSYTNRHALVIAYYYAGRMEDALLQAEENVRKYPDFSLAYFGQSWVLRFLGRHREAVEASGRSVELAGDSLFVRLGHAQALAAAGRRDEALAALDAITALDAKQYVSYYQAALVYAYLGETEKTFEALERAVHEREGWLNWLHVEPVFARLRPEMRFQALLKKVGHGEQIDSSGETISMPPDSDSAEISDTPSLAGRQSSPKSIAVLPFRIVETEPGRTGEEPESRRFLSVGLADALITRLSNVRRMIVRPTSSVLFYGGELVDSSAAGRELGVDYVLDSHLIYTPQKIRVSVQLLDVKTQSAVWAERFDAAFTDALELERAVSEKVAGSLLPHLTGEERRQLDKRETSSAEAHEAYLRGRFHWNKFTEDGFAEAFTYYQKALALDPDYTLALAALADYYIWLGMYGNLPVEEFYAPAERAALRAIELDEKMSEAYAALGLIRLYGKYDWIESERHLRRALELNPNNSIAHLWYTHVLYTAGRFAEGRRHLDRALALDPLSFQNYNSLAWYKYFERDLKGALAEAEKLIERFPLSGFPYFAVSSFSVQAGKPVEALAAAEKALELSDDVLFQGLGHGRALAAAGRFDEVEALRQKLKIYPKTQKVFNFHWAIVYCAAGDRETAFRFLDRSLSAHESVMIWLATDPGLDLLREDSRYFELMKKINHPSADLLNSSAADSKSVESAATAEPANAPGVISAAAMPAAPGIEIPFSPKWSVLKIGAAALVSVLVILFVYNLIAHSKFDFSNVPRADRTWRSTFASTMSVKRLTTSGDASREAISPDGRRLAFTTNDGIRQTLWIRDVDGDHPIRLGEPQSTFFLDLKFSPDAKYVYYILYEKGQNTLYRIPAGGGAVEQILDNIDHTFAFSPDGRQLAYAAQGSEPRHLDLLLADLDAGGHPGPGRTLTFIERPNYFIGSFSFSPDGTKIAYPVSTISGNKEAINVFIYDTAAQSANKLGTHDFRDINGTAWRSAEEVVISASENDSAPYQLWLIAYPDGETTRLTNDFNNYLGISLSADARALVTTKRTSTSNLWISELPGNGPNPEARARQITSGIDRQDGMNGVSWTAGGKILYVAEAGTDHSLNFINPDGTDNRAVPTGASSPSHPSMTTDGQFIVYADEKDQELNIWKYSIPAQTAVKMSANYALTPALSPDNQTVFYSMLVGEKGKNLSLYRQPLDGGEAVSLLPEMSVRPVVSPDAKSIAFSFSGPQTNRSWQLGILPLTGGSLSFKTVYPQNTLKNPQDLAIAWTPDMRSIYFLNTLDKVENIYRVDLAGEAQPVQLTHFTSGEIFDFSLAPDGKRAVIARGSTSNDIVIFRNTR